jgi:hypothetical protein
MEAKETAGLCRARACFDGVSDKRCVASGSAEGAEETTLALSRLARDLASPTVKAEMSASSEGRRATRCITSESSDSAHHLLSSSRSVVGGTGPGGALDRARERDH